MVDERDMLVCNSSLLPSLSGLHYPLNDWHNNKLKVGKESA